ncbi:hypothetical protein PG984_002787 [Apiospora sp. TS-2023a]
MALYTHPGGQVTLLPPPEGHVSDFAHPVRQWTEALYWGSGVFHFLTILFISQRCYTHFYLQRKMAAEDAMLLTAWGLNILITIFILRTVADGTMGTHAYELELPRFMKFLFDFYPMPIIYPLCCMFAKMSLMYFYTRLNPSRLYQAAAWFGLFFVFGSNIGLAFATAFPCKPLELSWNPLILGTCIDRPATYKATAIIGLLSDVYLILLPVPTVVGLQMPWQQKAGLCAMFAVGILTICTSGVRLHVIIQQLSDSDVSWGSGPTAFWVIVEANLMIVCATLPSLRQFLLHVSPKLLGMSSSSSSNNGRDGAKEHSEDSELVTFGQGGRKGQKKRAIRLPDTLYGLDTFNDTTIQAGGHPPCTGGSSSMGTGISSTIARARRGF